MAAKSHVDAVIDILEAYEDDKDATLAQMATAIVNKVDSLRKKDIDDERKAAVEALHAQHPLYVVAGVLTPISGAQNELFMLGPFRSAANARAAGPSFASSPDKVGTGTWRVGLWVNSARTAWESVQQTEEDPVAWIKAQAKEAYPGRWAAEYWENRRAQHDD